MKLLLTIFTACITYCLAAQQPPAQLPSLLEANSLPLPILHSGESPDAFIRKHVFVQAAADKSSVFAGEPLLVTYKLYTAFDIQPRVKQQPAFKGCSIVELSADNEPVEAVVDGQKFHVYTIRKLQLTPLVEGMLQLSPVYVDNIVQLLHDDGRGMENYAITLHNEPLNITVKALPAEGRPADYTGVVGRFSITASVDNHELPAGENASLKLVIEGTGNIEAVRMPGINWPEGIEHFDGSDTQRLNQNDYPVKGLRQFTIPFIGNAEGDAVIAPVSFCYFDPSTQQYATIRTDAIPVKFTPAVTREQQLRGVVTTSITNQKYLWIVGGIALTVLAVWLIGSQRKRKTPPQPPINVTAMALAHQPAKQQVDTTNGILASLEQLEHARDHQHFFAEAKQVLQLMISEKTGISTLTDDELTNSLQLHAATKPMANACGCILDACNRNLYTPIADEKERNVVLQELNALYTAWYAGA